MSASEDPLGTKPFGPTVFISNLSEDVWPFIQNISDPVARTTEIEENANLADRDLFTLAGEDRIVLITPKPISDEFLAYFKEVVGKKQIEVLVPATHSGKICEDIQKDPKIMDTLIKIANSHRRLTLIAYSTSLYFLELVRVLRAKGLTIYTPESPEEIDGWTVNFFGSKSGIRQLFQTGRAEEPDLIMPTGYICFGIEDAAKIAAKMYLKEKGVVIKTNKGHCGLGVLIFRPGELAPDYPDCKKQVLEILKKDEYWDKFPIIVEEYIDVNPFAPAAFPNVEFKILKSGQVEFLYPCSMRVTKDGVFRGIEINDSVISDRIEAQIIDTGFYVGEQYAKNGYRGYFEIDFIKDKNNKVYASESNVRRTGGTHSYETAVELFGKDFMYDVYVISQNSYALPKNKTYTFSQIKSLVTPILFDKKTKEGLVIVSENLLVQKTLAYIIFAKNKRRAEELETQMKSYIIG
jgi:hypothetical protein